MRTALEGGPRPAFDVVPEVIGRELPEPMMIGWGLAETLCYLRHLELRGEVEPLDADRAGEPERWALSG